MHIKLDNICPVFLEEEKIKQSQLWNRLHSFEPGEHIQLVAPSGSGKTSFIHFLYALRNDYKGSILYNNKALQQFSTEELAAFRSSIMSIVFQDLRLFATHTVAQNIIVKKELNTYPAALPIATMAEQLGIGNKLNQPAGKCSYGEQQRVAIIRALQQPFSWLILDEPFSHLDEANSKLAMALIEEEVKKRNAGIILADLQAVSFFKADRMLQL